MATNRKQKVAAAVGAIRAFYQLGRKLSGGEGNENGYDPGPIWRAADEQRMNVDTVRKARQFADPARGGYTPAELGALCRLIREVQPGQAAGTPVVGRTHVLRLLSVPREQRQAFQEQAVRGGWSTAELEAAIAGRFGPRQTGGRPLGCPRTRPGCWPGSKKNASGSADWRRPFPPSGRPRRVPPPCRKTSDLGCGKRQRRSPRCTRPSTAS